MSDQPLGEREALLKCEEIMARRSGKIPPISVASATAAIIDGMPWHECHEIVSREILSSVASMAAKAGLQVEHQDAKELVASSDYGKLEIRFDGSCYKGRVVRNGALIFDEGVSRPSDVSNLIRLLE